MQLIAITGAAGSGKTFIAEFLCQRYGFERLAFADPLYEMISVMTDLPIDTLKRHKDEPTAWRERGEWINGPSPRYLLQTLGTEWGRDIVHHNIWVRVAERRCFIAATQDVDRIVFDDCRFANEAEWVRAQGGKVWMIAGMRSSVRDHASERGLPLDLIDAHIANHMMVDDPYHREAQMSVFHSANDLEAQIDRAITFSRSI